VLPHLLHLVMRQEAMLPFRRRVIGAAEGRVLEIGIGSGLNLPLYGLTVREVIGLDPSPELLDMARDRAAAAPVHVKLLEASAEAVPLDDASIDTVVTTWTLHYPGCAACAGGAAPRTASRRGATVRRARPSAGAGCGALAGQA
jgi:SAM-dependent methyltransferase